MDDEAKTAKTAQTRGDAAFGDIRAAAAPQRLAPGTRLGPYEIDRLIGAGGMGEVYGARDLRLGRTVAIKVVSTAVVTQSDALQRFEREARTISALNHPHICALYDVGEQPAPNGSGHMVPFLVMEYLEGETLAERLRRGPLPLDEALRYTRHIVEALDEAHRSGVVHRDLKPSNVVLTRVGAKLLDFGVAKLREGHAAITGATTAPALTSVGDIIGTTQYMAPEQLEGQAVDGRTDIFALGALIYEMVSGRRAFEGASRASIVAAILERDPPSLSVVQPLTPSSLDALVRRCLAKRPADRWQSCGELLAQVDAVSVNERSVPGSARRWARRLAWTGAAVVVGASFVGLVLAGVTSLRRTADPLPVLTRLTSDSGLTTDPAVSADGRLLAFASDRGGEGHLDIWVKQVAGGDPVRLTRDAGDDHQPAFSPDGTKIVFRSEREGGGIYVVSALGGAERLIAREGRAPQFSPDGQWIAYWTGLFFIGRSHTGANIGRLFVVAANGGAPIEIQAPGISSAYGPIWSPDGTRILFQGVPGSNIFGGQPDWWVVPFDGHVGGTPIRTGVRDLLQQSQLSQASPSAWIAEGNHIIFSATAGDTINVWRIALSPPTWHAIAAPTRLTFGTGLESQAALVSVAGQGGAGSSARLIFSNVNENVDIWALPIDAGQRAAAAEPKRLTTDANLDLFPALSGDGRTLAFTSRRSGNNDIWVKDLESAEETPIVTMPWDETRPALTRDARKIAYEIRPEPPKQSCQMITLGPTRRDAVAPQALPANCWRAWSWSSDGTKLLYLVVEGGHHVDLFDVVSGKSRTVLESPKHRFYHAYFSPDDRWVSFLASGRAAVAPYRDDAPLSEASWIFVTDGESAADKPRWSPDGKRIYYTSNVDGFRCIWARNVDALTKRPLGSPFAVYHSHAARLSMLNVGIDAIELGVSEDKLVFPMTELTGNIWMTTVSQMK